MANDVVLSSEQHRLEREGRVWARAAISEVELAVLDRACRLGSAPGARLTGSTELLGAIGQGSALAQKACALLPGAFPVRAVLFNKSSDVNWQVSWHQDRVIPVREKHAVDGFGKWTKKAGVWHVEAPVDLLRKMIFAVAYLDDAEARSGCLELALASHTQGRVTKKVGVTLVKTAEQETCTGRRGDVVFVKALTLHRSRPSQSLEDRRTLRVDYCAESLPKPLAWAL